jgi:hypothetical protein
MSRSHTPSLSRAASHSSLWRSWSPTLEGLTSYDKSRDDYPWLAHDDPEDRAYDHTTSRCSRSLSLLAEVPDAVSQSGQSIKFVGDLEEQSAPGPLLEPQDEDPTLVSGYKTMSASLPRHTNIGEGYLGWSKRPVKPSQLEQAQEMALHYYCLLFHIHLSRVFDNAGSCFASFGS